MMYILVFTAKGYNYVSIVVRSSRMLSARYLGNGAGIGSVLSASYVGSAAGSGNVLPARYVGRW